MPASRNSTNQSRSPRRRGRPNRPGGTAALKMTSTAPASAPPPPVVTAPFLTGPGSFAGLGVPPELCGVLAAQGLHEPFPIQTATLGDSLAGRDVLGQGRTGSGKTLAFALPIVARLTAAPRPGPRDRRPRALVLVPTRELAAQVDAVIAPLAAAAGLRTATVFGGVGARPQLQAFAAGVPILVACPGRLLDHLDAGAVDLSAIEVTVLDEADHMADVGFLPMVRRILDATPPAGQRLLFSATLAGGVDGLVQRYLSDPVSHAVATEAPVEMSHHVLVIDHDDRVNVVADLARAERTLVFTRTKHRARQLARKLAAIGIGAVDLHGNLSQNARTRNLEAFACGEATVLVATDIAARGIHVDEVPLVVHADPPLEHKAYVHRSGRTARAGSAGAVVTVAAQDQVREVEGLLRQARVRAAWSTVPRGGRGALDAVRDGGGPLPTRRADAPARTAPTATAAGGHAPAPAASALPARTSADRPAGRGDASRPPRSSRNRGRGRRSDGTRTRSSA